MWLPIVYYPVMFVPSTWIHFWKIRHGRHVYQRVDSILIECSFKIPIEEMLKMWPYSFHLSVMTQLFRLGKSYYNYNILYNFLSSILHNSDDTCIEVDQLHYISLCVYCIHILLYRGCYIHWSRYSHMRKSARKKATAISIFSCPRIFNII